MRPIKIIFRTLTTAPPQRLRRKKIKHYGIDYGKGDSKTVITIWYGGRAYGKTFFNRLWMQYHYVDLISKELIRRLAAEALINISIHS